MITDEVAHRAWAQTHTEFYIKILSSEEAHFWPNSYINNKIVALSIWKDDTPLHFQKVNEWCALWAEGIIISSKMKPAIFFIVNGNHKY